MKGPTKGLKKLSTYLPTDRPTDRPFGFDRISRVGIGAESDKDTEFHLPEMIGSDARVTFTTAAASLLIYS